MIVLGIDPGYALMGWGVVEAQGARMRLLGYGCVETQAGVPMQHRLRALQLGVRDLVNIYHPDDVAFEELFFARNVTTALMVGAARGAAIISAAEYTESLYEYTPMQIKQAATALTTAFLRQIRLLIPANCREKVRIAVTPDFLHEQTVLAARCIIFLHLGTIIVAAAMALTAWKEASAWNIPSVN